ncbi:MAG: suppressor of fused domain protein [Lawsonella sp.]
MEEPTVVMHMERRLGRIAGTVPSSRHAAWTVVSSDVPKRIASRMPVSFKSQRLSAVWTVGLSFGALKSPQTGHTLRMEFFTLCDRYDRFEAERVMGAVAEAVDASRTPILRGQVIGPLPPEAGVYAMYATMPRMFDADFATCETEYGPVAVVWLLPIGPSEEKYILDEGWKKFERILFRRLDIDPADWGRAPVC